MINVFSCPECGGDLTRDIDRCFCALGHTYPVINGQYYFLPMFKTTPWSKPDISNLVAKLQKNNFAQYMVLKKQRGIIEPYAAFQPFNESFQTLLNCIDNLKNALKPGDVILDTWCRTGWTGDFLATTFPNQKVISIWEGDNSVLGYKGFQALFNEVDRASNHTIIFHDPNKPLPIKSDTVAFCFAYDSLHRYQGIADEVFRVTKPDGIINFAHVHLSNAEPEPFFERGGTYRKGKYYQDYFQQHIKNNGREVSVMSELDVYRNSSTSSMVTNPETDHYNGFIWVAHEDFSYLYESNININSTSQVFFNPLLKITEDYKVHLRLEEDFVRHLLLRHPFLNTAYSSITDIDGEILRKFAVIKSFTEVRTLCDDFAIEIDEIHTLVKHKVIFVCRSSVAMVFAQSMHMNL
ncbi:hypothetical protein [Shewanella donghaensis]|uniref:hypothetical protein n=1 Tax=Shewanella donghaensis TaxID=238836 RepID=UPI0011826C66|nr:hypothetical protein [Shewanella donghaensis]